MISRAILLVISFGVHCRFSNAPLDFFHPAPEFIERHDRSSSNFHVWVGKALGNGTYGSSILDVAKTVAVSCVRLLSHLV